VTPQKLKRGTLVDATARTDCARTARNRSRESLIESLPVVRRVVRPSGISLHSIRYWSDVLTAWIGRAQKMEIRYDPHDLSRIYLRAPDGDYYDLSYRDLRRPPISLREHQLAIQHLRKNKQVVVHEEAIFQAVKTVSESVGDTRAKNPGRICTSGRPRIRGGPTRPVANRSPEKSSRPTGKGLNPWRRMLTVEKSS
jgi:putative transposase